MTTSISGTTGVTFPDSSTQATAATGFGFKNRIINGAMGISQRGTSFTTPASGAYTLDRWQVNWGGAAPASVAQVAGPTGFRNAVQITGAASNTSVVFQQRIESYNCSDLSGATITIQANIAVSSAQTVQWYLLYANAQDNWTTSTAITSGTWSATTTATVFTATITGLPSGATNGLQFNIYPQNGGAFTSGTITITGVQLEKSPTATSFDWRPYGTELALCQRYFESFASGSLDIIGNNMVGAGNNNVFLIPMKVTKRGTPSLNGTWTQTNVTSVAAFSSTADNIAVNLTNTATGQIRATSNTAFTVSAEL